MQYLRNAESDFDPVFFYLFVFSSSVTYVETEKMVFTPPSGIKGAEGGLHQDFLEIDCLVVSDRGE